MYAWIWLTSAILFEVAGTTCLKLSNGMTRLGLTVATYAFYATSFALLSFALKTIDLSIAYAIWSGLGTSLIAILGVLIFNEPITALKVVSILLIIAGVIGLNLSGGHA